MAAVILFDGECNFCNYWVNLVIQHDKPGYFRFAPLKSTVSRNLIAGTASDLAVNKLPDSLLLVEDGKIYWEAAAILRIIRRLAWFWPAFYLLLPMPRFIINTVYRKIAASRHELFGRQKDCVVPSAELQQRLLADPEIQ